jgi:hypothetical protein
VHGLQLRERLGIEDVAVARPHRDQHLVRAAEVLLVLEERLHVRMLERQHLGEARLHFEARRRRGEQQRDEQPRRGAARASEDVVRDDPTQSAEGRARACGSACAAQSTGAGPRAAP